MGEPCAQLYIWHNGPPQRCGLSPPRRLFDDHGHADKLAHDAPTRIHGHRAAIPLQRLEPHLDDAAFGRHGRRLPRHFRQGHL